jgi:hypothetical protein
VPNLSVLVTDFPAHGIKFLKQESRRTLAAVQGKIMAADSLIQARGVKVQKNYGGGCSLTGKTITA